MKKLLIIGASGHGKVIANIAYDCNEWDEISFLDDDPNKRGNLFLGFKVIDDIHNIGSYIDNYEFIVGIGNSYIREKITNRLHELGGRLATLIHPTSVIGLDVKVGKGTVVMPMCVINASSVIGEGCIINTGASVDHDCEINSFTHLSPGVTLSGTVKVGSNTWIGAGTVIINNVSVTTRCTIGAGSTVIKDIIEPGTYVGTPARKVEVDKR